MPAALRRFAAHPSSRPRNGWGIFRERADLSRANLRRSDMPQISDPARADGTSIAIKKAYAATERRWRRP